MENISHDVAVKTLQQTQRVVNLRVSRVVFSDESNTDQHIDNVEQHEEDEDGNDLENQESGVEQPQDENFVTSHMDAIEVSERVCIILMYTLFIYKR